VLVGDERTGPAIGKGEDSYGDDRLQVYRDWWNMGSVQGARRSKESGGLGKVLSSCFGCFGGSIFIPNVHLKVGHISSSSSVHTLSDDHDRPSGPRWSKQSWPLTVAWTCLKPHTRRQKTSRDGTPRSREQQSEGYYFVAFSVQARGGHWRMYCAVASAVAAFSALKNRSHTGVYGLRATVTLFVTVNILLPFASHI
jgi:hypothetical protein